MMFLFNMYYRCVERKSCDNCPFYSKEKQKCLFNEEPRNYDLEKLQRAYEKMALEEIGEDISDEGLY